MRDDLATPLVTNALDNTGRRTSHPPLGSRKPIHLTAFGTRPGRHRDIGTQRRRSTVAD